MNVVMIFKYGKRYRFAPSFNRYVVIHNNENASNLKEVHFLSEICKTPEIPMDTLAISLDVIYWLQSSVERCNKEQSKA